MICQPKANVQYSGSTEWREERSTVPSGERRLSGVQRWRRVSNLQTLGKYGHTVLYISRGTEDVLPTTPPDAFIQDFNTNFLRTSNSRTARSELVNVSQNHGGESRRQQDPNHPPKRRRVLNPEMRIET